MNIKPKFFPFTYAFGNTAGDSLSHLLRVGEDKNVRVFDSLVKPFEHIITAFRALQE